ncbi:hypothetical protein EDB80DRAFT_709836 [Ilyonectria destructans]|nr:hypothetical protein EDB80DRAFT_709836 [Ilyonectria destructans]
MHAPTQAAPRRILILINLVASSIWPNAYPGRCAFTPSRPILLLCLVPRPRRTLLFAPVPAPGCRIPIDLRA